MRSKNGLLHHWFCIDKTCSTFGKENDVCCPLWMFTGFYRVSLEDVRSVLTSLPQVPLHRRRTAWGGKADLDLTGFFYRVFLPVLIPTTTTITTVTTITYYLLTNYLH